MVSYLVRILGGDVYGVFVWAFSIIQYLVIVVNFGFNIYAAKYISDPEIDAMESNRVFSSILTIKLGLFLLVGILFIISIEFIPMLHLNKSLLLILLGFVLGEALFPIWFFQGKEKLGLPTKIVFAFKFLLVFFTILLIGGPEDLLKYAGLLSASQFSLGLAGLLLALKKFDLTLVKTRISYQWKKIKEGAMFFISTLCSKTFNLLVIFLAGIWFTMKDVASFDIAFKIIAVFQLPLETLSIVLFPTISRSKNIKMNERIIFLSILFSLLLWAFTYWQSDFLLGIMGGQELLMYAPLLQKLSVLIPIVVTTYFLGTNTLVAFGYQRDYNLSIIIPTLFYLIALLILWMLELFSIETLIYSRIAVDGLVMSYRLIAAYNHKLIFTNR